MTYKFKMDYVVINRIRYNATEDHYYIFPGIFVRQCGYQLKTCILIMKTCLCNLYPLEPHFYIVKLRYAGVYLFLYFLLQNIHYSYSLEPPQRGGGGSNMYPQFMFCAKIKNVKNFTMKISILTPEKNLFIAWTSFCNQLRTWILMYC